MGLTESQVRMLERMRDDNARASAPFVASGHWKRVAQELREWFDYFGIGNVEEQRYQEHYSAFPPSFGSYYVYACQLLWRELKRCGWSRLNRLASALPKDSPRRVVIDGQPLSWDLLISADSLLTLAEVYDDLLVAPCTVAEIGAGWGRMAYTLKQMNPQVTYLIFDLPETLLIASDYLPRVLSADYVRYDAVRDWSNLRNGAIWFCAAHELDLLPDKSIDFVISTGTFQEMPPIYVDAYFDRIDRIGKTFYLLQHEQEVKFGDEKYGNYFPVKPHWVERYKQRVSWFDGYFEAVYTI